jgi:hypothetical protein
MGRRWSSLALNGEDIKTFKEPVTQEKLPKLYVIKHRSEIIYVGQTKQSIRKRLNYGLTRKKEYKGYKGYMWKELKEVDIYIFCLPHKTNKEEVEGIEAELVYQIRKK